MPVDPRILDLCREDPRFAYEAYDFVCDAVTFTQDRLGRADGDPNDDDADRHVSGGELLRGVCDLAVQQFGLMAAVVFKQWGIRSTDDGTMAGSTHQVTAEQIRSRRAGRLPRFVRPGSGTFRQFLGRLSMIRSGPAGD